MAVEGVDILSTRRSAVRHRNGDTGAKEVECRSDLSHGLLLNGIRLGRKIVNGLKGGIGPSKGQMGEKIGELLFQKETRGRLEGEGSEKERERVTVLVGELGGR